MNRESRETRRVDGDWLSPEDRRTPERMSYDEMCRDVRARLSGVCAHLSPEAFDALVAEICDIKVRYPR